MDGGKAISEQWLFLKPTLMMEKDYGRNSYFQKNDFREFEQRRSKRISRN
jgi:hypothetical protein